MTDFVPIEARCLCRSWPALVGSAALPRSSFPLKANACHCRSCRLVTGALCTHYVEMPLDKPPFQGDPARIGINGYKSSEKLTRWFCPTCSAHIAVSIETSPTEYLWSLELGAIPQCLPDGSPLTKMFAHIYVQPEDGGGFAQFFHDGLPHWTGEPEESQRASDAAVDAHAETTLETLPLRCHCGKWNARLKRPAPTLDESASRTWRVKNGRWRMAVCACETCRLTSGFPYACCLSVCKDAIESRTDDVLSAVRSCATVTRTFCNHCGASVYYEQDEAKAHGCISVFMGLVDAPLAPVLRDWVWRDPEIMFPEEGEKNLTKTLMHGWSKPSL